MKPGNIVRLMDIASIKEVFFGVTNTWALEYDARTLYSNQRDIGNRRAEVCSLQFGISTGTVLEIWGNDMRVMLFDSNVGWTKKMCWWLIG